jgi:hypothetical protein
MDLTTFLAVKKKNIEIIQRCLKTGAINFDGFTFWEGKTANELPFDTVTSKWADILGCTAVGAIPSIERRGADGYMWYSQNGKSKCVEIEAKVCGVNQGDLALGKRGGLYYSVNLDNSKSKCAITSHFAGRFDVNMSGATMLSKERDTYLVMFDRTENKLIGSYKMSGKKVLRNLIERRNNDSAISLKLSAFQYDGIPWHSTLWKTEGYSKWEKRMIKSTNRYIQC